MKQYPYDLQTHSTFSDGDHSPDEMFYRAQQQGLKGIIITDHNTIAHLDAIRHAQQKYHLFTLEGIEISTRSYEVDVHILGYASKLNREVLYRGLRPTVYGMQSRLKRIVSQLQSLGYDLDFNTLRKRKGAQGVVFKYDLIKEVAKQANMSLPDATKLMERGGSAYAPYTKAETLMTPKEAVLLIRQAGGKPFLAHPADYRRSSKNRDVTQQYIERLIIQLKRAGLTGIEIRSAHYGTNETRYLQTLAQKYNLIPSGGSDWHGDFFKPHIKLGCAGLNHKEFDRFSKAIAFSD